jgi:uncharacterized phage protein (TIGR01671 family)
MRDIKFRGQKVDNKEWVYGGYYEWNGKSYIVQKDIWDLTKLEAYLIEVIPETVGQYTGLKDKNGKEIYEGDLLKLTTKYGSTIKKVKWGSYNDDEYVYNGEGWICNGDFISDMGWETYGHPKYEIEVVGNIHNSELLEVQG